MSNNNNNRHLISAKINGNSNIPLRRTLSRNSSNGSVSPKSPLSESQATKWRQKYEDSEDKRKALLSEKEKALRSLDDLEKKHLNLQVKHDHLETELFEKNEEYAKLSIASKNLYKEYETLKNRYETETDAIAEVLKDTYKENKELKRRTLFLSDKDTVDEGVDTEETNSDADIGNLNKTIKQLSNEVAELQTELDSLKQTEFQTSEQNIKLAEELEEEKKKTEHMQKQVDEIRKENEQLLRVSEMMKKELETLKEMEENQRNYAVKLRKEADDAKKERNVLAHRSTILLQGLNDSNGNDYMLLLEEMENLKRSLEDQRIKYEEEIAILQERIEDEETNSQVEILEERLKLAEADLREAVLRAEAAEERMRAPPAPPPPPPPPPAPPPADRPPAVPLRRRRSKNSVQELAESIGLSAEAATSPERKPAAPGVNEDIINAIKEGKFTLRKAKKDKRGKEQQGDTPKAVSEILNILGSLKRAPKKRQSQFFADLQS